MFYACMMHSVKHTLRKYIKCMFGNIHKQNMGLTSNVCFMQMYEKCMLNCLLCISQQSFQVFIDPAKVLSMFMLLFILVMVCGLFELKRICTGFCYLFIHVYVLLLEIQLSRGIWSWDPINWFNKLDTFCACSTPGPEFPSVLCFSLFYIQ